ncbi:neural cell adhesion molecule 1-like [Lytechinus variegatus]|uniref:neural cell adhesion molecule 1-like n=1 Tax=Lytechinus variegatus TaxID=7654 RepID=UPI001BB2133A|nr:neural cell adhesion molecule 1-like [Lytechinus variegatus]
MDCCLCILLFFTFFMSETYEVSVSTRIQNSQVDPIIGEDVTLVCTYKPSYQTRILNWRNGNGDILATDRQCQGYGCYNSHEVSNSKYSLIADSSSGNLTIVALTSNDSGMYQCFVSTDFHTGRSQINMKVQLPAITRSLSITINRSSNEYKNGATAAITYGRTNYLKCSVQSARSPAELEWQVPEEVQAQQQVQYNFIHVDVYTSYKEVLLNPDKDDDGKMLRCVALHQELDHELQLSIILEVQVSPTDLILTAINGITTSKEGSRSAVVSEDLSTSFTCKSVGSRPQALIYWFIGSNNHTINSTSRFSKNEVEHGLHDTESILELIPKRGHHRQVLRCVAIAGISQRQVGVKITVYGPPDPPYLNGTEEILDGVPSIITCTANNGYPTPTFQWFLSTKNITNNSDSISSWDRNHRVDARSVLAITPTRHEHGKRLVCEVHQGVHRDGPSMKARSVSSILRVLYSPVIVDHSVRRVSVDGDSVDALLTCTSDSRPVASITWFCNGKELNNSTRRQIHRGFIEDTLTSSVLIISNISAQDDGYYTCFAETMLGYATQLPVLIYRLTF